MNQNTASPTLDKRIEGLLRTKSPRLYEEHVRRHEILGLRCKSCLDRHMAGFTSSFGFDASVFEALQNKTEGVGAHSCHETKLSEDINVRTCGELKGFVDLGPFTERNEMTVSDHSLTIMFQPFQGEWLC